MKYKITAVVVTLLGALGVFLAYFHYHTPLEDITWIVIIVLVAQAVLALLDLLMNGRNGRG